MIKWLLRKLFPPRRDLTPDEWLDSVQGAIACNWQARPWGNGIYSDERANQLWKWSLEEYERRKAGLPFEPPPAERKEAA